MWTDKNLAEALNQHIQNRSKGLHYNNVVIDSKVVKENDIFIGIKGPNHDGGAFAADAIKNGASLCITHFIPEGCDHEKFLVVNDTYSDALLRLANYNRNNKDTMYIGVTGSVGKTTTKEMLKLALKNAYANEGNKNNHYGLPLSLANMDESSYGIFELGMNAKGEISYLSKILRPHVGIITGIAPAHLEFFTSLNEIAAAKAEILDGLSDYLVVNFDSPAVETIVDLAKNRKVIGYSTKAISDDIYGKILIKHSEVVCEQDQMKTIVTSHYTTQDGKNNEISYKIGGVGKDLIMNSAAVLGTILACNLTHESMHALEDFNSITGRGKLLHISSLNIKLMDESYNSNPTSLASALNRMNIYSQHSQYKRKIAVLGDMLELGPEAIQFHKSIIKHIIDNKIDKIFCVGKMMRHLFESLEVELQGAYFETADEMAEAIVQDLRPFDVVMVKGSNSLRMSKICSAISQAET
jgi:UDP-N-acetylmuramoyl-tripeptide--D-alanyl-D-alanine ligase